MSAWERHGSEDPVDRPSVSEPTSDQPASDETLVHQTRLERDASRANPDNWARIDHTARVDADRWDRDPPPRDGRDLNRQQRSGEPHLPDPESTEQTASAADAAGQADTRHPVLRVDEDGRIVDIDWQRGPADGAPREAPGRLRDLLSLLGRGRTDDSTDDKTAGGDQSPAKTWLETDTRPPPVETTRVYRRDGYLDPPLPREQESLDRAVPRDQNGDPVRFPDPRDQWSSEVNGEGVSANPFRGNNCLDCSLAAISTWYGEPRVSAPRHAEYDISGAPIDTTGEIGGPARAERWLGHKYDTIGPDASAYSEIARRLTDAGHGASAAILNWWPWGGGHAWNAFNHQGTVYWVDTQHQRVSDRPIYPTPGTVEAIIMDSEGNKA